MESSGQQKGAKRTSLLGPAIGAREILSVWECVHCNSMHNAVEKNKSITFKWRNSQFRLQRKRACMLMVQLNL